MVFASATTRVHALGIPDRVQTWIRIISCTYRLYLWWNTRSLDCRRNWRLHDFARTRPRVGSTCVRSGCQNFTGFLVAYAAYQPRRPLQWYERAVIAVSGPALQISVGTAILLLGGINPLNRFEIGTSDASVAVWWASVALGILNLLPVLPLDGGAIVSSALERLFPRHGQIAMIRFSLFATTASVLLLVLTSNLRGFLPFIVFLLIYQVQALRPQPQTALQQLKPSGDFLRDSLMTGMLVDNKSIDVAISYGSESFALCPFSDTAVNVARALVLRSDPEGAVKWLHAAKNSSIDFATLLEKINLAYEFQELHGVAEFDLLHAQLLLRVQNQRL